MVRDLRMLVHEIDERTPQPRAAILDSRTIHSSPESGRRASYDGHKCYKGLKLVLDLDTLGQLLAILVTPVNEQDWAQFGELAKQIQEATGYKPAADAQAHGIRVEVVKLPTAKCGFVMLPRLPPR